MSAVGSAAYAQAAKPAAAAAACKLQIAGSDTMQFDKKELKAPATCKTIELTLKHSGKLAAATMGHNWVLVKTADAPAITTAGLSAGLKNNHVPPGDKRVIAATKVVGGGQSTTITFPTSGLTKGGDYTYICTFPGHSALMKGKFVFN
jgi:azurin